MSAETIPAEVLALARKVVADIAAGAGMPRRADAVMIGDMDGGPEVKAAIHAILADRSTRPAESAPEAEVGDGFYDPDVPAQQLRLHFGEMTVQEIRTARAAIRFANSRARSTLEAERAKTAAARADAYDWKQAATNLKEGFDRLKAEADELRRERDDLRDKAAIGVSLMERIADLCKPGSRHEHWAPADDPAEIVFDLANEADDLRRERDEAQSACTAWQSVYESIEAHIKDRIAMRDPADPETYLRIIRGDIAGVLRASQQIVASRWHEAKINRERADAAEASLSRALQDRDEAVRVAAEDELDRLLEEAVGSRIMMVGGGHPAWVWLRGEGAMLPAERARLRADQGAPKEGQ